MASRLPRTCGCGRRIMPGERCPVCQAPKAPRQYSKPDPRYSESTYRTNRQIALKRSDGRCAQCGEQFAWQFNGQWRTQGRGDVHHALPLSKGGTHDPSNLVPMCSRCHDDLRKRR